MRHDGGVVREGGLVDVGAVVLDVRTIVHSPAIVVDVFHSPKPIPRLLGESRVRLVAGVSRKSGSDIEEASVGDGYQGQYKSPIIPSNLLFL